jgi:RNA polymerase sigma-70 factor (ECF subfamily)
MLMCSYPVPPAVTVLWSSISLNSGARPHLAMSPDPSQDASALIAAVARGDRSAFTRLFEYFAPRIKTFMLRSGTDDGHAEELAQEAMLAVWRHATRFDPGTNGGAAWIFTIARNLRIDALRRQPKAAGLAAMAEIQNLGPPLPEAEVAVAQTAARVKAAVARLPAEQREVVFCSFYEEHAHAEIAATLAIPLGTVKSRLRLAMARLRTLLDEDS